MDETVTCTRWVVMIPEWRPAALNELLKAGPYGANRLKRVDRDIVAIYTLMAHVPFPSGRRRISLEITLPPKQRRWDIDALQKSTLDAAKYAYLIRDDGPKWAEWGGVAYSRGFRLSTTIIVEDIP